MRHGRGDSIDNLCAMAATLRRWIVEQSFASGVGHIGSALSVVDVVAALWGAVLRQPGTELPDRDRFILSKGHAALALYAAMRWRGIIDEETFHGYCRDGSRLGVHPEVSLPGVDAATGSLGQGLSVGCGMAYGLRLRDNPARVYVLVSDAECNEGQIWEAAMFAAHHRLANLTVVVDLNGLQALGATENILDLSPLGEKWRAFGWKCRKVDGHDVAALCACLENSPLPLGEGQGVRAALQDLRESRDFRATGPHPHPLPKGEGTVVDRPRVILARTMLGKGVSFMENQFEWHYRTLDDGLYATAMAELEAAG